MVTLFLLEQLSISNLTPLLTSSALITYVLKSIMVILSALSPKSFNLTKGAGSVKICGLVLWIPAIDFLIMSYPSICYTHVYLKPDDIVKMSPIVDGFIDQFILGTNIETLFLVSIREARSPIFKYSSHLAIHLQDITNHHWTLKSMTKPEKKSLKVCCNPKTNTNQ